MKPYLVKVRIPDAGPSVEGTLVVYVAMVESEAEALEAVKGRVAAGWTVHEVVGVAPADYAARQRILAGWVGQYP